MLIFGRGCRWEGVFKVHETGVKIDLKYCTASVNSFVLRICKLVSLFTCFQGRNHGSKTDNKAVRLPFVIKKFVNWLI
jgi:hypothetical protein